MCKRKPDEIIKYDISGTTEYVYYDQVLFQHQGTIYYGCLMGVNKIHVVIPVTEDDGKEVFYYVSNYMCNVYSKKDGFFHGEIIENVEDRMISQQLGADFGTVGISVQIRLKDDEISVLANYQY